MESARRGTENDLPMQLNRSDLNLLIALDALLHEKNVTRAAERVREALLRIQATLGTQPSFDPGTVRRAFTLIVSADAVLRVMPTVFRRITKEAPGIQCHVEHFSETTLSRLEYGDADLYLGLNSLRLFGLRAFPETLRIIDLRAVRWLCAVSNDHPTVGDQITEQEYLSLPHVFGWPS